MADLLVKSYMVFTLICVLRGGEVSTGLIMGTIGFCILELILHTFFGTKAYFRFRKQGKQTIYGPGSITAYFGFGVLGVILCRCMPGRTITTLDWIICILVILFIGLCCVLLPENLLKKKDNQYFFKTNGYYDRYL